ncbi:hypothetical protein RhiirB3_446235 [Rhizophagus irregularis]|nr:hypothetical protein RhiirB3_446235 [Rhizophagus irregularis]
MSKQAATISGVPKIVSFLENLEQNGFFSQFGDNNQAYGSNNYSYPPHDEFVTEEHLQKEYNDSQSGYESSSTVETHNVFPDTDYTPSRPTGGYPLSLLPLVTNLGGLMMDTNLFDTDRPLNPTNNFSSTSSSFNNSKNQKNQQKNYNNNDKTNKKRDYIRIGFNGDFPEYSYFNSSSSINFATLNLQGGFKTNKKHDLITYMIDSNIHCLLLTETHLKDPKNCSTIRLKATPFKYIHNNKNVTFYIIHNPSPTQSASGVSFIISSLLYQRIQKIEHIPGRLIHITFFFRRHEQLHVLGIYLPPITSSKNNTETLKSINLYLKTHLDSKNQYKKNIIMVKIYNETPSYTFKNTSNHISYIDIIFVSPNLISHTICASIVDAPIHTDHRLILVALNHKFFNPSKINFINNTPDSIELNRKNSLAHNERYNYKKITKEQ